MEVSTSPCPTPSLPSVGRGRSPLTWGPQCRSSPSGVCGCPTPFGSNLPTIFTIAVESALPMALTRSYTGLANDLARRIAGPVDATTSGRSLALLTQTPLRGRLTRELGPATSETRAQLDVMALLTAARANSAATVAPSRAASPAPAPNPRGGGGGGPSGRYSTYPSSSTLYRSPPREPEPYHSPTREMGPQGRDRDGDDD